MNKPYVLRLMLPKPGWHMPIGWVPSLNAYRDLGQSDLVLLGNRLPRE
jgi:hypothetical protein